MWPWRRSERAAGAPAAPSPAWRSLPPIQRSIGPLAPVAPREEFAQSLQSWHNPSFLAPLGHLVSPEAPSGVVDGLLVPARGPLTHSDGPPMELAPHPAPRRGVVQRMLATFAGSSAPDAPTEAPPGEPAPVGAPPVGVPAAARPTAVPVQRVVPDTAPLTQAPPLEPPAHELPVLTVLPDPPVSPAAGPPGEAPTLGVGDGVGAVDADTAASSGQAVEPEPVDPPGPLAPARELPAPVQRAVSDLPTSSSPRRGPDARPGVPGADPHPETPTLTPEAAILAPATPTLAPDTPTFAPLLGRPDLPDSVPDPAPPDDPPLAPPALPSPHPDQPRRLGLGPPLAPGTLTGDAFSMQRSESWSTVGSFRSEPRRRPEPVPAPDGGQNVQPSTAAPETPARAPSSVPQEAWPEVTRPSEVGGPDVVQRSSAAPGSSVELPEAAVEPPEAAGPQPVPEASPEIAPLLGHPSTGQGSAAEPAVQRHPLIEPGSDDQSVAQRSASEPDDPGNGSLLGAPLPVLRHDHQNWRETRADHGRRSPFDDQGGEARRGEVRSSDGGDPGVVQRSAIPPTSPTLEPLEPLVSPAPDTPDAPGRTDAAVSGVVSARPLLPVLREAPTQPAEVREPDAMEPNSAAPALPVLPDGAGPQAQPDAGPALAPLVGDVGTAAHRTVEPTAQRHLAVEPRPADTTNTPSASGSGGPSGPPPSTPPAVLPVLGDARPAVVQRSTAGSPAQPSSEAGPQSVPKVGSEIAPLLGELVTAQRSGVEPASHHDGAGQPPPGDGPTAQSRASEPDDSGEPAPGTPSAVPPVLPVPGDARPAVVQRSSAPPVPAPGASAVSPAAETVSTVVSARAPLPVLRDALPAAPSSAAPGSPVQPPSGAGPQPVPGTGAALAPLAGALVTAQRNGAEPVSHRHDAPPPPGDGSGSQPHASEPEDPGGPALGMPSPVLPVLPVLRVLQPDVAGTDGPPTEGDASRAALGVAPTLPVVARLVGDRTPPLLAASSPVDAPSHHAEHPTAKTAKAPEAAATVQRELAVQRELSPSDPWLAPVRTQPTGDAAPPVPQAPPLVQHPPVVPPSPVVPVLPATPVVQTVTAPEPAASETPSGGPVVQTAAEGAPAAAAGGTPDELVKKLFDPLLRRIKAELRLDRERRGMLTDLRH